MKNQWQQLAPRVHNIQKTKNEVLWPVLLPLIKRHVPMGRVFDDGCGWGEWADCLAHVGYDVTASDPAPAMVVTARLRFTRPTFLSWKGTHRNKRSLRGSFDAVTSNLVLCLLPIREQRAVLKRLRSLVSPQGIIIVTFCHPSFDLAPESLVSVRHTPVRAQYSRTWSYTKRIKENNLVFTDMHRPLHHYFKLFAEEGLAIVDGAESLVGSTNYLPDFIIFVLKPTG